MRRSTSFATTAASTITPRDRDADPAADHRSSQSIGLRPAKPSSRPCHHSTASSPARQQSSTLLALAERREVEQAGVGVLHLDAERGEPRRSSASSSAASRANSGVRASPTAVAAAVAGDDLHDLALLALELA